MKSISLIQQLLAHPIQFKFYYQFKMLQEKCCRDIADNLHRALAKSFLNEFAARLNVDINQEEEQPGVLQNQSQQQPAESAAGPGATSQGMTGGVAMAPTGLGGSTRAPTAPGSQPGQSAAQPVEEGTMPPGSLMDGKSGTPTQPVDLRKAIQGSQSKKASEFQETRGGFDIGSQAARSQYQARTAAAAPEPAVVDPVQLLTQSASDPREFHRNLKKMAANTPQDKKMKIRQKKGQLRVGDVILIAYREEINFADLQEQNYNNALQSMQENATLARQQEARRLRSLALPDFVYKGVLYTDGVTDQGIKVIPQVNDLSQNGTNCFKQCLFRIEIKQDCSANLRQRELLEQKKQTMQRLEKLIQEKGGEEKVSQSTLLEIKKELEVLDQDLAKVAVLKANQEENNKYNQKLQLGQKITYGQPVQLRHLFSGDYLTLDLKQMSLEYGCCQMYLSETREESWFTFQPASGACELGEVVNFNDFFCIKSLDEKTPFFLHVFKNANEEYSDQKSFVLNASQEHSMLRAKLFMSYEDNDKAKMYVQSGDVIRLKHAEANGYLTTSQTMTDMLLPAWPDFLKGQHRRMLKSEAVERQKGGKERAGLTNQERMDMKGDQDFERVVVTDEYTKKLKSRVEEQIYIELEPERLCFTNSCWQIQRVNSFKGGDLIIDEVYRIRHVVTGKFLAVADDKQYLCLKVKANTPSCLFTIKSDMETRKALAAELDEHGDAVCESQLLKAGQRVMIQSFAEKKYLQLFENLEAPEQLQFKQTVRHIDHLYVDMDSMAATQLKVINHTYCGDVKQKMMFYIEEIQEDEALYAYKGNCVFDELLEFYAFLNVWAVSEVELDDTSELYFYDSDKAIDLSDGLFERVHKALFILQNIEDLMQKAGAHEVRLKKCKEEITEQGILDILMRSLELIYYKTVPPCMFQKPFISSKFKREDKDEETVGVAEPERIKIDEYVAQEIAREHLDVVMLKVLGIVLNLIRAHRTNSEKLTKYFGILFQIYQAQELYQEIAKVNRNFECDNAGVFLSIIAETFRRTQKNAIYVHSDRSANALIEYNKRIVTDKLKARMTGQVMASSQSKSLNLQPARPEIMGLDSKIALENIERSSNQNVVQKWLDLLEPIRYVDADNQNVKKQLMVMSVVSMFCRDKQGQGIYAYQMQIVEKLFENDQSIPIKFGVAKVGGNILRPFVVFSLPKAMSSAQFLAQNPILAESNDNFNMQQRTEGQREQYELIFDLHEMTKNAEAPGKETQAYIDYICGVLNMYAHLCLSANAQGIKAVLEKTGMDESHILCCTARDNERLVIHEKLKQMYMQLAKALYISNDPLSPGIQQKNRCYVWDRLVEQDKLPRIDEEEQFNEGSQDNINAIENDLYAGKKQKRTNQMNNPNNSMIVLRKEQDSKDLELIRLFKDQVVWFLQVGPQGTESFFYHHHKRNFQQSQLKLKIKSLKVYLDTAHALIEEDCVHPAFIDNILFICQCIILGTMRISEEQERILPAVVKATWVYILTWLAQSMVLKQSDNRQMKNALRAVEMRVLDILEKVGFHRLNLQVHRFLLTFRKFQEANSSPHVANVSNVQLEVVFQNLFKIHQLDSDFKMSDILIEQKVRENQALLAKEYAGDINEEQLMATPTNGWFSRWQEQQENFDDPKDGEAATVNKRVPFDVFLLRYVFNNASESQVRNRALEVLIQHFNQRHLLVKELVRSEIIVSKDDYEVYFNFLQKQRQVKMLIEKLVQDEMFHMVYKKSPSAETNNTKKDIISILKQMCLEMQAADDVGLRKLQNMIRHIGMINDLVNVLLKRLVFKELSYRDLFQAVVDFLFQVCFSNPNCQLMLLGELNFFLDMLNNKIETGLLISEIIKANKDQQYCERFIRYLVHKIIEDGFFKSELIQQLVRLAEQDVGEAGDEEEVGANDRRPEHPNQQLILKLCIKSQRFRHLVFMKKQFQQKKLGVIKTYAKKQEQYNLSKKDVDSALLADKEQLDLHVAVVDLVAACARNSPFGVAQAQKLIECEELLDTILSDAIPYIVKKHYLNLLYEVYLRKVPGLDETMRLNIVDIKFVQIMKWVVQFDLEHSYNYFLGLVIDAGSQDPPDVVRKLKQVRKEVDRVAEQEYDEKNAGKTEKDKDDERRFKAELSSFKDAQPFYVIDTNDSTEYWRYLYERSSAERKFDGLICFIERFFRDYTVRELNHQNMQDISCKVRDRLLAMANKIYGFIEVHENYIRPNTLDMLNQFNIAVQKIPTLRSFRVGKKRIVKNGVVQEVDEDASEEAVEESMNADESRDLDNRMCGDKILRILRDYIIKENLHIKDALGINFISSDIMVNRDELKNRIKRITGSEASYDEIMKALDHFHKVSFDKKQERQVMNVEPGQQGYILNKNEGTNTLEEELRLNIINYKDVEIQLKDVLKKAGYKPPSQQRERSTAVEEAIVPTISEQELSVAVNMDLRLFIQRFLEFVHLTENVQEIHDFVAKLMSSNFIVDLAAQRQFVDNMMRAVAGVRGIEDDLIFLRVFEVILCRLAPEDEDELAARAAGDQYSLAKMKKQNDGVLMELRQWQDVMFEAGLPDYLIGTIHVNNEPFLCIKSVRLLNLILMNSTEQRQQRFLDLIKKGGRFFNLFFYIKERLYASKQFLVESIKESARQRFVERMEGVPELLHKHLTLSDLKNQNIYITQRFDIEYKLKKLQDSWRQDEMNILLKFLNSMCENCFRPAQIFLRKQVLDETDQFKKINLGKTTSIDLIQHVLTIFISIVSELGDYVLSDFRTYKLVPLLLDTIIEFMYGPCIENQLFIGKWSKFIRVLNSLMDQQEMGNYSGIHQEAKAQLAVLYSCSQVLLAIVDIKERETALACHEIILQEIDTQNLVNKMVDIYIYKIGGSAAMKKVYQYEIMCTHWKEKAKQRGEQGTHCIADEFCEYGHMIPRDKKTIQTGFNIYQILMILQKFQADHLKLKCFERDITKYQYLMQRSKIFDDNIFKRTMETRSATFFAEQFRRFNKAEQSLLDEVVARSYPKLYLEALNREAQKKGTASALLQQVIQKSKTLSKEDDQVKMLQRVREKIQRELGRFSDDQKAVEQEFADLELALEAGGLAENPLLSVENYTHRYNMAKAQEAKMNAVVGDTAFIPSMIAYFCGHRKKNKVEIDYAEFDGLEKDEKIQRSKENRMDFEEKLAMYKFFVAGNFYLDNIGKVEICLNNQIVETTFMFPSYVQLLTDKSRKEVATHRLGVSQHEKLEAFLKHIDVLKVEMIWQQRLGQLSPAIKTFANQWFYLSWINFLLIILVNLQFIQYLVWDQESDSLTMTTADDLSMVQGVGLIQTAIAFVVLFSYYLENRAKFQYILAERAANNVKELDQFGMNKGSRAFGFRKSLRVNIRVKEPGVLIFLRRYSKKNILTQLIMFLVQEVVVIIRCIQIDQIHFRNVVYAILSAWAIQQNIVSSLLLLDIVFKIESLRQVLSVFNENKASLAATLALFVVCLYIAAFLVFNVYRADYEAAAGPDDGDGPDFNLYCDNLLDCMVSTINVGVRAGGGIGEAMRQPLVSEPEFYSRALFDFSFFIIVNIILMNILFGIIIDSFADKRAQADEFKREVRGRCFVCGISKSRFDIENVVWTDHIYCEHNLHSYVAFILYVQSRPKSECTGIEKFVKQSAKQGQILFFPINRCASIRNGEFVE